MMAEGRLGGDGEKHWENRSRDRSCETKLIKTDKL